MLSFNTYKQPFYNIMASALISKVWKQNYEFCLNPEGWNKDWVEQRLNTKGVEPSNFLLLQKLH